MDNVWTVFLLITLVTAGFAWATAWSRRETRIRHLAFAAFLGMLPLLAVGATETMGWHKSSLLAWRLDGEQNVLASKVVEGEAIYLYLDVGEGEPRAIALPWDPRTAERLQKAQRESARRGRRGAIMKFDHSWDRNEPQFHPLPQPQMPIPKDEAPPEPKRLERSA